MKTYKRNGKFVFLPGHRLEVEQVRSLFGRFFREVKSQQSEVSIANITENIVTDIAEGNVPLNHRNANFTMAFFTK